ncbi:transporter [Helicobacter sp. MIT 05-5293]|uniref:OmpP1/FadL family transporter n=1 Tax=Helicobacter sp. MIT 05-5293 TaxID=1548149 RepID=UPI00051CC310|nr:outer membrane protein transport protein [Helicobacter sp. MIT 05-5293]TLD81049.1 transporter [Helicobacter sp. MIT 05-5293]
MRFIIVFVLCLSYAFASGFKINEQSLNSTALNSAYIAGAHGADSVYYNPANMGFSHPLSDNEKSDLEITLTGIFIPGFNFTTDTDTKSIGEGSINWGLSTTTTMGISDTMADLAKNVLGVDLTAPIELPSSEPNQHGTWGYNERGALVEGSADPTFFPVPKIFYKSSTKKTKYGNLNWGVSFTAPSGLAMNWNGEGGAFLRNVMIAMVELSPSFSWNYNERIAIGVSPRFLYGMGNFKNTVFVPLGTPDKPGKVTTNIKDFDEIPDSMIPEAMAQLIYAVNTTNGLAGVGGLFVGGGGHYNNELRYKMPTLFSPEAWFGMPDPSVFDPYVDKDKQTIDVAGYNAKVKEINATIKNNWETYKSNKDSGAMTWGQESNGYNANGLNKGIDHINSCILTSNVNFFQAGCKDLPKDVFKGEKGYINCYTGTHYDFNGNLQTSYPGVCTDPSPTEKDEDGAPRGYLTLMDAKQVAEAFGMGDMEIYTDLVGATKVDQKSNGGDFAFGYKVAMSVRPFESKKTTLSIVYTSPVKFDLKGSLDATTYIGGSMGDVNMKADLTLSATLPSQLQLAIMHSFGKLNVEFVYEEIYWSKGDKFAFNFSNPQFTPLSGMVMQFTPDQLAGMMDLADYGAVAMGDGWKDTIALRLGLTYLTEKNTLLMLSAALDQAPVPQDKLGIPDSNAYMFGIGAKKMFTKWNAGIAYSLSLKDGRKSIYQTGGFGQLHLLSASLGRQF